MDVKTAIARKDRALNQLQTQTAWLLFALDHEDLDRVEDCIRDRQSLLRDLQSCDEVLRGTSTPRDATWSLQLQNLVSKEVLLKEKYQQLADRMFQEFRSQERERLGLMRTLGEAIKGQITNTRA